MGGGPAGLSELSGLARVRRKVLLIDSGEYRNGPTRHMHDVLGFDGNFTPYPSDEYHPLTHLPGVTPAYFRYAARQQLSHYNTVSWTNGTVTKITPGDAQNTYFTITTTDA